MNEEVLQLKGALSNIQFEEREVEAEVNGKFVDLYADDQLLAKGIRIRASDRPAPLGLGNLSLDTARREATVRAGRSNAVKLRLTNAEYEILFSLLSNVDRIVSKIELAEILGTTEKTVATHINDLRHKLREENCLFEITFVHGGYRLDV